MSGLLDLATALGGFRFIFSDEDMLQRGLEKALHTLGVPARREVKLARAGRIDFLLDSGIGIEVKLAGAFPRVAAQVQRYLERDELTGLLLVTTHAAHRALPTVVAGKPLHVHLLRVAVA